MGVSNTITLMILTYICLTPDPVANWYISGDSEDHFQQNSSSVYSWEQSWKSQTDNNITTITTSTSGTIPPNAGLSQGASSTWSYTYCYSSGAVDEQHDATSFGTPSTTTVGSSSPAKAINSSAMPFHKGEMSSPPKPTVGDPGSRKNLSAAAQPPKSNHKSPGLPRTSALSSSGGTALESASPSKDKISSLPLSRILSTADGTRTDEIGGRGKNPTASQAGHFQDWLDAHNNYRSQYGVESLTWSEDLVEAAKKEADKCVWKHTKHDEFGENIAAGQNSASEVVIAWVEGPNEREVWNPSSAVATHFTQVVWKDTKQIGCAFRSCETIAGSNLPQSPVMFWACEYHPRGNVGGEYTQNVLAAAGGKPLASASTAAFASVDPDDPSRARADGDVATRTTFFPAPE
ncbi:hypothetical protein PCANC_17074 [Puccinia coronata f. sp. avenae]|uniref:SCP domain-containing protein n=1 Tax=Puccinia coronata f. sp. avenae TaxID=200324 RepID=A0A2N5SLC0_9BASI|nr:hypothetical protein PCANC_17074 [Puccinia coronata f. sp. avenae]